MEQSPLAPQMSGNVLFYKNPEPITPEHHGKLGVKQVAHPYAFVAGSHIIPVTVTEFAPAGLSYPVIFVGEDVKTPLAVMGLRTGDNLYIDANGDFRTDAYVPAFVRRYPFVYANDTESDRMILCVDRSADFVGEDYETPFFVDGKPSDYTNQAMQFCNDFETERQRTTSFMALLAELDLLDRREANFTPRNPDGSAGQPQKIADYWAVSEEKLAKLSPEKFTELRDNGALGQIYAHMNSLMGWDRLIAIAMDRAQRAPAANA
ncbi:SapC family protein [Brevundimonas aveniformis]|uniref:SapC family protein n=1 Tax=Brevundimonas aveniformis TaxID=370977 RepID=UPI002493C8EC|nr:SapC family protein [Brevundimonas aveniformis]